jgi:molybdopterin-containing oxidoreductase family iron-sulfur binding subunit
MMRLMPYDRVPSAAPAPDPAILARLEAGLGRSLTRREVLRLAAVTATIFAAGSALDVVPMLQRVTASDLPGARPGRAADGAAAESDHQWAFIIDLRRCDGCGDCTRGCQEMHYLAPEQEWIRVYDMTDSTGAEFHLPVLCQMCEQAPCVQVCPVTATYHLGDGPVVIDQSICIGCRMCMAACPYGVRTFNWKAGPPVPVSEASDDPLFQKPQRLGTVGKCDSCVHETRDGRLPACVTSCSMLAIYSGDFVTDIATNGRETVALSQFLRDNDVYRLKEELGTETRVYYVAGHGQHVDV